jgi:hypothetical protein
MSAAVATFVKVRGVLADGFEYNGERHQSLRVRIAVRTLRWDLHALHAPRSENPEERLREQRVSIMDWT